MVEVKDDVVKTSNKKVQDKILAHHNLFRSRVEPPAANMLKMKWHKGAAEEAQKWAEQCKYLVHSYDKIFDKNYGLCGQNLFVPAKQLSWFAAIKKWYSEVSNFTYGGDKNHYTVVGHYTQLVWAATHEVGCGVAKCDDKKQGKFYNYVCNYCPIGNDREQMGHPYKSGKRCSSCKKACSGKSLCTNSCPVINKYSSGDHCKKKKRRRSSSKDDEFCKGCKATCECKGKIY